MELRLQLAEILVSLNACSSAEEAEAIAEIVLELDSDNDGAGDVEEVVFSMQDALIQNLIDNLDIEHTQAKAIVLELKGSYGEDSDDSEVDSVEETSLNEDKYEDEDSDGEYLEDGECELCDRFIKLTRHHLIPKQTWPRMQAKLFQAAEANESGDRKKARLILGHGLEDLLGDENENRMYRRVLSTDKAVVRSILHDTCDICRQCHSTVHSTHSNMELALNYNSIDKLLGDERIAKFCKWASKQKSGKYKRCWCCPEVIVSKWQHL